jgi:hypothetical protein
VALTSLVVILIGLFVVVFVAVFVFIMAFLVFVVALVSVPASVLVFVATFIVTVTILVLVPVVFAELVYVALVVPVNVDAFAHAVMTGVIDSACRHERFRSCAPEGDNVAFPSTQFRYC